MQTPLHGKAGCLSNTSRCRQPCLRANRQAQAHTSNRRVVARVAMKEDTVNSVEKYDFYDTSGVMSSVDDALVDANNMRKTKIVATLGPTSGTYEAISEMADKGMNVCRMNMSHGDHESHGAVVELIKKYNTLDRACLAILLDTKGPEVRSGDLGKPVDLVRDEEWIFTIQEGANGTDRRISVNYDGFIDDVTVGDELLVDGGIMSFRIVSINSPDVICKVVEEGVMGSRRHLNIRGKSANLPAITDRDWKDIEFGVASGVDYFALSFVRDAECIYELKAYLKNCGCSAKVLAKIESADAVENLDQILDAVDGAMVARGDLGAELPVELVPFWQSGIIQGCRKRGKPVIVATNMLESMIENPSPTRAEVSDISVAVREGTDAIMLSGETAYGKFPLKSMQTMSKVAKRTEYSMTKYVGTRRFGTPNAAPIDWIMDPKRNPSQSYARDETFAYHATTMANTMCIPILTFTETGRMPEVLSHYRPDNPIFAFTEDESVRRSMALYYAVVAFKTTFDDEAPLEDVINSALQELKVRGILKKDDMVAVVQSANRSIWKSGCSHAIHLQTVF